MKKEGITFIVLGIAFLASVVMLLIYQPAPSQEVTLQPSPICGDDLCAPSETESCSQDCGTAECISDYREIDGNLMPNPLFECDNDEDGIPDGWRKIGENLTAPARRILSWVDDPQGQYGKVLQAETESGAAITSYTWRTRDNIQVEKDEWYKFEVSIASNNVQPELDPTTLEMISPAGIGSRLRILNGSLRSIDSIDRNHFVGKPELTQWDEDVWIYRTYTTSGQRPWTTYTKYIQMPDEQAEWFQPEATLMRAYGIMQADNFSLIKVDSSEVPFAEVQKNRTLSFIQYEDEDFFPIVLYGFPNLDSSGTTQISLNEIRSSGFNTLSTGGYNGMSLQDRAAMFDAEGYPLLSGGVTLNLWRDDPLALVPNTSCEAPFDETQYHQAHNCAKNLIHLYNSVDNLLAINLVDEATCHQENYGSFPPDSFRPYDSLAAFAKSTGDKPLFWNHCGQSTNSMYNDDLKEYLEIGDYISNTMNLPWGYYITSNSGNPNQPALDKVGLMIRRNKYQMEQIGIEKPIFAFGLGVNSWAQWNETRDGFPEYRYIPYNLQRFQVWNMLINGAEGVWFYGTWTIDLDVPADAHFWEQIKSMGRELAYFEPALLEPQMIDDWEVSDSRVEAMMKIHNDKIYLFTTSTHHEDLTNIDFTLNGDYTLTSVTAIHDVINGDVANPINRTISLNGNSFTDDFIGEDASAPQGVAAPGYETHVYEITYTQNNICGDNDLSKTFEQCECGTDLTCGNADDELQGQTCVSLGYPAGAVESTDGLTCSVLSINKCVFNVQDCSQLPLSTTFSGNSTNFTQATDIGNVSDAVLENEFGIINFTNTTINFTRVDLDTYVTIEQNRIEIDTTAPRLNNLDAPAIVTFNNINFITPKIQRNGIDCPPDVCTEISYASGAYQVRVTGFSSYEIVESYVDPGNPGSSPGGSSGGGGGGGGSAGGPPTTFACNDNIDNDNDGLIDYPLDQGCTHLEDTDETDLVISESSCTENWSCEEWSECSDDVQFRDCTDLNECSTTQDRPSLEQSCSTQTSVEPFEINYLYVLAPIIAFLSAVIFFVARTLKKPKPKAAFIKGNNPIPQETNAPSSQLR